MKKLIVVLIFTLSISLTAQERMRLDDFSGGLNLATPKGGLPAGQFLKMTNFIINGKWLEVRQGITAWLNSNAMSSDPITAMYIYQTKAEWSLIANDGNNVWTINDSSDMSNPVTTFNYTGNASCAAGDSILYAEDSTIQWLSQFGDGSGMSLVIAADTYTVSHILLDSVLILTDTLGATSSDTAYSILVDFQNLHDGLNWGDEIYLASDRGLAVWNGNSISMLDSVSTVNRFQVDSVYGSYEKYRVIMNSTDFGGGDPSDWTSGQFNGWYMMYTTNPIFYDSTLRSRYSDRYFKTLFKIKESGADYLLLESRYCKQYPLPGMWGAPTATEFVCLSQRHKAYQYYLQNGAIDSATAIIVIDTLSSGSYGTETWLGLKIGSALSIFDSSSFESGDYMVSVYGNNSTLEKMFIIGGIIDTITIGSSSWQCIPIHYADNFLTNGGGDTTFYYIDERILIYKMVEDIGASAGDNSYEFLERYENRLFFKKKNEPNNIYWSVKYFPDSIIGRPSLTCETYDGDWVTGLRAQGDFLNVYKNNSILQIFPQQVTFVNQTSGSTFDFMITNSDVGCIAPNTIVDAGGVHYFLSKRGFALFDGNNSKIVSDAISDWLEDSLNYNQVIKSCAEYYDGNIWLSMPSLWQTANTTTFIYHVENGAWTRVDHGFSSFRRNTNPNDTIEFFIADADSGVIGYYGGTDDFGDSIVATLQTDYMDFGVPQDYKQSREFVVNYTMPTDCKLGMALYRDYSTTAYWLDTLSHTSTFGQFRLPNRSGSYGRNLSLELKFYNGSGAIIPWLEWLVVLGGLK